MIRRKTIFIIATVFFVVTSIYVIYRYTFSRGVVMIVSLSTDGRYAITTDDKRNAVLWDLHKKSSSTLDRDANIYSAYFIKDHHLFMWQNDLTNQVNIANTHKKIIENFNPGFPTYGQAISSNLKYYIASNEDWDIYIRENNQQKLLKKHFSDASFLGAQKLANITIQTNNLLISGFADVTTGVSLWNLNTKKLKYTLHDNSMKTIATISPDGKYIVSGDEEPLAYVWEASTGKKLFDLYSLRFGREIEIGKNIENWKWDNTGMLPIPSIFNDKNGGAILTLKFIDLKGDYLRFTTYVPYAILYNVNDPKPKKYLYLGSWPYPSVDDYSRDQSIDTAPKAHILVMGKRSWSGIIVYKFDPEKETLKRIWVSH